MTRLLTISVFLMLLFALALSAQEQMEMPKAPELKNLDYFAGTWSITGEMKPGPMGPGGKMTETEQSKWMDGGYFLESHIDYKSSMGNGTGISFLSYDANDKMYTYDEFNSAGEAVHSKGMLQGDTWTWTNDEKMGGQTMKGRFTMKILSPTSYTFKFEMSQDGTNWNTILDGTATKQK